MKKIFIAIVALAAVAACSNSEIVSLNQEAIAFDNAFVNNSTRSVVDPSFVNTEDGIFADFVVYGYVNGADLFPGTPVSKTISNTDLKSVWKYEGTQYWIEGGVYDFSAVAPLTDGNWTLVADSDSKDGLSLEFTNDGTTDLLYAKTTPYTATASGNPMVGFNFKHVLSKVKFSFENAYNADYTTIKVHSIAITNAYETAIVDLSASTPYWSAQDGVVANFSFGVATDIEGTDDKENAEKDFGYGETRESQNELLLIPADYTTTKLNVTFKYDVIVNGTTVKTFTVTPAVEVNLLPGNAYDFKATIAPGQPIEFTVSSIEGWTENAEQNM